MGRFNKTKTFSEAARGTRAAKTPHSTFELTPHKLVYGGAAIGFARGQTVLVAGVIPGERVEVEPVSDAKGITRARVRRILMASPGRQVPPCPYFNTCGGCHYQHLAYPEQIHWKREILRETLRRIGKVAWEGKIRVHQAEPWHYRNQAEFKVERKPSGEVVLGFYQAESHHLVPIERCEILSPCLNAALKQLNQTQWRERLGDFQAIHLRADSSDERVRVLLRGKRASSTAQVLARDLLLGIPQVIGVIAATDNVSWAAGKDTVQNEIGGFEYQISAGAFFQTSRFLVIDLVRAVLDGAEGKLAMDLYAGVGLFSLPLAQRFAEVHAVESELAAAHDLEQNARAAGLGNIRISNEKAEDFLRRNAIHPPHFVVLDPPRAGAGPRVLGPLAALRPDRICYVSCHPPTQARDLGFLLRRGYRLESVELFDLFPQTYHIESLARLARTTE